MTFTSSLLAGRRIRITICILLTFLRAVTLATCLGVGIGSNLFLLATNLKDRHFATGVEGTNWPGSPGIPRASGGPFGFALSRILICIILFLCGLSDFPLPQGRIHNRVQELWEAVLPCFMEERGLGMMGFVLVVLGSSDLGQDTVGFSRVAAWMLMIVGMVNFLLGVTLRSQLRALRSPTSIPRPSTPLNHTMSKGSSSGDHETIIFRPPTPVTLPTAPPAVQRLARTLFSPISLATTRPSVYSTPEEDGVPAGSWMTQDQSMRAAYPVQAPITVRVEREREFGQEERKKLGPMDRFMGERRR